MLEMTLWGEMHEGLKNEKMTPTSDVDDYIIQLNNEMKGTFVKKKMKKKIENIKENNDLRRLCAQVAD